MSAVLTQIGYNIRMTLRNTSIVIWCVAFPIIMATIFMTMFQGIRQQQDVHTISLGIVEDEGWRDADGLRTLIEELSRTEVDEGEPLFALTSYESSSAAREAVLANEVETALAIDDAGAPRLLVSPAHAGTTDQAIVQAVVDRYLQGEALAVGLAANGALTDASTVQKLARNLAGDQASTAELGVLREPPSELSRYYYALLGYSCITCANVAQLLIDRTRAGMTPAGMRRQASSFPPGRQLAAALAASWIIVMGCMMLAVGYFHFVAGVSFGGRIWLTPVACGACALVSCAFGALVGALPGVRPGVKDAVITIATLALSLPAGLFGTPALELANWLSINFPLAQLLNPAVQATETLFALTFYDSLEPFARAAGTLIIIAAVLGTGAWILLRRQRHACC